MKKILLMALFAIVAVGASAQKNISIWWGGNVAKITDADSEFKALNIGVFGGALVGRSKLYDQGRRRLGSGFHPVGRKRSVELPERFRSKNRNLHGPVFEFHGS